MDKVAALLEAVGFYELMATADDNKVYGPYTSPTSGRKFVILIDSNGNRRTVSYPKYLVEQHLGRKLDSDLETIDHRDRNFDNNDLSNLRIVERSQHSKDDTRRVKLVKLNCAWCKKEFERSPRLLRDKAKKNKAGPFCSRTCAGCYSRKLQLKLIDKFDTQPAVDSEYYRNIKAVSDRMIGKYGEKLLTNN